MTDLMDELEELMTDDQDGPCERLGLDLFINTATPPSGAGPFAQLTIGGGVAPDWTMDRETVAYVHPSVQVLVVGKDPRAAYALAREVYDAFSLVNNEFIGDTWWLSASPTQEPHDLGLDSKDRAQFVFNVMLDKRPS